jgi:hypothetical protein
MGRGIGDEPAEEDQARKVAVGEQMPRPPQHDGDGERKPQMLAQPAAAQEDAEAEEGQQQESDGRLAQPHRRLVDRHMTRDVPADDDEHQGERRGDAERRPVGCTQRCLQPRLHRRHGGDQMDERERDNGDGQERHRIRGTLSTSGWNTSKKKA